MQLTVGKKTKRTVEITSLKELLDLVKKEKSIVFTNSGSIFKFEALFASKS